MFFYITCFQFSSFYQDKKVLYKKTSPELIVCVILFHIGTWLRIWFIRKSWQVGELKLCFSCTERKKQIEIQFQLVFMNYTHWVELKYSLSYKILLNLKTFFFCFLDLIFVHVPCSAVFWTWYALEVKYIL